MVTLNDDARSVYAKSSTEKFHFKATTNQTVKRRRTTRPRPTFCVMANNETVRNRNQTTKNK